MKFLKGLGLGIVYFLISPFIFAGSLLYMLYGLGRWFVLVPVGIIRFFKGEKFFKPLKADLEVESAKALHHDRLVKKEIEDKKPETPVSNTNTTYVQNNYYSTPNPNQLNNNPFNQQLNSPQYKELQNPELNQLDNNSSFENEYQRPLLISENDNDKKEGDGE